MTDDLRWRDLSSHEGPAEPPSAHADFPEDDPAERPAWAEQEVLAAEAESEAAAEAEQRAYPS